MMDVGTEVPYLDKGYVRLIEVGGSDEFIARFARCSFNNQNKEYTDDENRRLINYLVANRHTSPIEAGSFWFEMKMPIFVMRQHGRHRTASLNEQSLRYAEHDGDFYLPPTNRFCENTAYNKQGSGEELPDDTQELLRDLYLMHSEDSYSLYKKMLEEGLARETARAVLGTNFYTTVCWKMDTKNLLHYLSLRDEGHAQHEIQELAQIIASFVEYHFPMLYQAHLDNTKNAIHLSSDEREVLSDILKPGKYSFDSVVQKLGSSKRKARAFLNKIFPKTGY